jgi:uncharacterized surface protein with fasciclin (FAS1) repeats
VGFLTKVGDISQGDLMTFSLVRTLSAVSVALAAIALPQFAAAADQADTVVSVAAKAPELSTFYRLIDKAGLTSALAAGELTVFAPTDEAFKAMPAAKLQKLEDDAELLKTTLTYHVVASATPTSKIGDNATLPSLQGAKLSISKAGDFVTVDEAMVIKADIAAGTSVIHEIDRVLQAPAPKK